MGERSTAGSICDTKPVEVNRKLHKKRGSPKMRCANQVGKPQNHAVIGCTPTSCRGVYSLCSGRLEMRTPT